MSRFRFVDEHRDNYDVKRLCWLVAISRSGYYAWRDRPPSARQLGDDRLGAIITTIHADSRGTYGRPRICGQLRRHGETVNHKRVGRIMRQRGLAGVSGRKKWRRGRDRPVAPAPDLLQRDFAATQPDCRWVGDITEFATDEGTLYLAGILDLSLCGLVGWSMGPRRPAELVVNALAMAIARRDPSDGVIHHADRGSQPMHVNGVL